MGEQTRRRLVGYDLDGAPRYAEERSRPTSTFSLRIEGVQDLPAGDYGLALTLTDPLLNAGTLTATVTR